MKIFLRELILKNFMGIRHQVVPLGATTNIYGQNKAGKTTIFNSFTWLLFDKDHNDSTDFAIKTVDSRGNVIPKIDHEVEGIFEIDESTTRIKKVLREKWETKRGGLIAEMTGHEKLYYWNDVPVQQKEFKLRISQLIKEDIFKLLTNVFYFNSLHWTERRQTLINIAGEISDREISKGNPDFEKLFDKLLADKKSIKDYQAEIASKKIKIKDELELIPSRIDEATGLKPEQIDVVEINSRINIIKDRLATNDKAMVDASEANKINNDNKIKKHQEIYDLQTKITKIENDFAIEARSQKHQRENEIFILKGQAQNLTMAAESNYKLIDSLLKNIAGINHRMNELRDEWYKENARTLPEFDYTQFNCPACGRKLEGITPETIEHKKEEVTIAFNTDKQKQLERIEARGHVLKTELSLAEKENKSLIEKQTGYKDEIISIQKKIVDLTTENIRLAADQEKNIGDKITADPLILGYKEKIGQLQSEIESIPVADNIKEQIRIERYSHEVALDELRNQLGTVEQIKKIDHRIDELLTREKELGNIFSMLDGEEHIINQFIRAKINILEERINSKFDKVKFRLFDIQVNGQEVPCCDTLIEGVPWASANRAGQINGGLEIINVLCDHYNIYCPIFIDNKESVNQLVDSKCQIINLIVSKEHKTLTIMSTTEKISEAI